jgi:hypothetical protein
MMKPFNSHSERGSHALPKYQLKYGEEAVEIRNPKNQGGL